MPYDDRMAVTQHITTNHTISLKGDVAHCFSYVHGRFFRNVESGGNMFESGGWYDDTLRRDGGNWLISKRVCRSIWVSGNPDVLATGPDTGIPELYSPAAEAEAGRLETVRALLGVNSP